MGLFGKSRKEKEAERLAEEKKKQEEERQREEIENRPVVYLYALLPGCVEEFPEGLIYISDEGKLWGVKKRDDILNYYSRKELSPHGIALPCKLNKEEIVGEKYSDSKGILMEQVIDKNELEKVYVDPNCDHLMPNPYTFYCKDMKPILRPGKVTDDSAIDSMQICTAITWDPSRSKPFHVVEFRRLVLSSAILSVRYRPEEVKRRQWWVGLETAEGKKYDEPQYLSVLPAQPFMMGADGNNFSELVVFSALRSEYESDSLYAHLDCTEFDEIDDMVFEELRRLNIKQGGIWRKEDIERFLSSLNRDDADCLIKKIQDDYYVNDNRGLIFGLQEGTGAYVMTESGEEIVWDYQQPGRKPDIIINDFTSFVKSKLDGYYLN